jgi:hypothetical protein
MHILAVRIRAVRDKLLQELDSRSGFNVNHHFRRTLDQSSSL